MRSYYVIFFLFQLALPQEGLKPLNFDRILPDSTIANLLAVATQIYYHMDTGNFKDVLHFERLSGHLTEIIGGLYILKLESQAEQGKKVLTEDLVYLANLMHESKLKYVKICNDSCIQSSLIDNLFTHILHIIAMIMA